jgi:hypothetical protein
VGHVAHSHKVGNAAKPEQDRFSKEVARLHLEKIGVKLTKKTSRLPRRAGGRSSQTGTPPVLSEFKLEEMKGEWNFPFAFYVRQINLAIANNQFSLRGNSGAGSPIARSESNLPRWLRKIYRAFLSTQAGRRFLPLFPARTPEQNGQHAADFGQIV